MTATKTAPVSAGYQSGFCGSRRHDRCRGGYAGVECTCTCHTEPEPEPEPVVVTVHCFFGCPHVVQQPTPEAAHAVMELHYFDSHRPQIRAAIGWMTS
jgi:hypothetical protein